MIDRHVGRVGDQSIGHSHYGSGVLLPGLAVAVHTFIRLVERVVADVPLGGASGRVPRVASSRSARGAERARDDVLGVHTRLRNMGSARVHARGGVRMVLVYFVVYGDGM